MFGLFAVYVVISACWFPTVSEVILAAVNLSYPVAVVFFLLFLIILASIGSVID